ncbi:hypothetical protein GDO81_007738 [Engystomops pustulosus]|uniref:Uncharacterized protein n=1 Tax=Engystomops pustulosus TaxID=76066 RepID=A0AAV7CAJ3_ENGPU|nr:hypothetical protein GDO81_007738 [Engystomops pustulosus]
MMPVWRTAASIHHLVWTTKHLWMVTSVHNVLRDYMEMESNVLTLMNVMKESQIVTRFASILWPDIPVPVTMATRFLQTINIVMISMNV